MVAGIERSQPLAVVIDHDTDRRASGTEALTSAGWSVEARCSGEDGIDAVRAAAPDVVVCGVDLPDIDGLAVVRRLQGDPATTSIPVLLVSGDGSLDRIVQGLDDGAHDYLVEPVAPAELRARCDAALRVRRQHLALEAAQHELRLLADHATDIVLRCTLDGTIRYVAPSVTRLLGWEPEQLVGQPIGRYCHPDDMPVTIAVRGASVGEVVTSRRRLPRIDGSYVWIESTAQIVPGPNGELEIQSSARDVTDQRALSDELLASEERLRLSFEHAPIGKALVAPDGRFLRVNPALCAILGYSEDELNATDFQSITHPDDLDADLGHLARLLDGSATSFTMEKRYRHRDGHDVAAQLDVALVRDRDGAPLHLIAQIQDITARRAAIESLQASQEIQRASLDALEQGVALASTTGEVLLLNSAGQAILGCTADELTERFRSGRWQTYHEDGTEVAVEDRPLHHTLRTGEAVKDRIVCWPRPDGQRVTLRVAIEPVLGPAADLTGMVIAFADITSQRATERAERAAVERIAWAATHDALTGLANRTLLLQHLDQRLAEPTGRSTAVLYVDLDRFKPINDSLGHDAGDELLTIVARRLEACCRADDLVARYGGDEFLVVLEVDAADEAEAVANRILDELAAPVVLPGGPVAITASIGLAVATGPDRHALIRDADLAMFRAKHEGRSRVVSHQLA